MFKASKHVWIAGSSYLNQALALAVGLVQIKLLTRVLTQDQYGGWVQANVTIMLIGLLFTLNQGHSIIRLASAGTSQEKHRYLATAVLTQFVIYGVALMAVWPVRYVVAEVISGQRTPFLAVLVLLSACPAMICALLKNFLIITDRALMMIRFEGLSIVLNAACLVMGAWLWGSVEGAVIGFLVAQLIMLLALLLAVKPTWSDLRFDPALLGAMLRFGVPLMIGSVSYWAITFSNRYLIGYFESREMVAQFNVANRLPAMIVMIFTLMTSIFLSKVSRMYEQERFSDLSRWMNVVVRFYLFSGTVAAAALIAGARHITLLVADETYLFDSLTLVYALLALASLFYGAFMIYSRLFELKKLVYRSGLNWLVALVLSVGLGIVLIPRWGLVGAAAAMLLAVVGALLTATAHRFAFVEWRVKPLLYIVFAIGSIGGAICFGKWCSPQLGVFTGLAASGGVGLVVATAGALMGLLTKDDILWVARR